MKDYNDINSYAQTSTRNTELAELTEYFVSLIHFHVNKTESAHPVLYCLTPPPCPNKLF